MSHQRQRQTTSTQPLRPEPQTARAGRAGELDRAWNHGNLLRDIAGARGELEARYRNDPEARHYALAGAGLEPDEPPQAAPVRDVPDLPKPARSVRPALIVPVSSRAPFLLSQLR